MSRLIKNCNTHIAQYLKKKKQKQSGIEIWSFTKIQLEKHFLKKFHA